MQAKKRIEYLKDTIDRINRETSANAELVRFVPLAGVRTLDNKKYSIVYNDQKKKFIVTQRVAVGELSEEELFEFLSNNRRPTLHTPDNG